MGTFKIFGNYFIWHYGKAFSQLKLISYNFVTFFFNFFSISILIKSFFSPWRRMGEDYPSQGLDIKQFFTALIINFLMRLVGIFMRTIIILFGLAFIFLLIILIPVAFIFWFFLPIIIGVLFIGGLILLLFG